MLYEETECENGRLTFRFDSETVWLEPWGENALRVRATKENHFPSERWALQKDIGKSKASIKVDGEGGIVRNGDIVANVTRAGKISIYNSKGKLLLEEYCRNRRDVLDPNCSSLEVDAREFKPIACGDYHLTARFESLSRKEKLYGMGQYQQPNLDLKGCQLELAHRNSQASVPFAVSSLGYGFLWNNPGVGQAVLGTNVMSFESFSTQVLDYWIVAGDSPADIIRSYAAVTGTVPMMPEYGLGFWQCKLRYQTQEELLEVAREYKRRNLPIDLIVCDFFHWPRQGEWKFDPTYWPDPDSMVRQLKEIGVELMVSIWPTVEKDSENFEEMQEKGYLIHVERGVRTGLDFMSPTIHWDATNPEARNWLWKQIEKNYYSKGIKTFWLDEAEPEYTRYDFENYRYWLGKNVSVGNIYPLEYARAFYEGQEKQGQTNIVNLLRCAWAGSQRYGALVWSGDIASSWFSLRNQLAAGLNMGIAGIPWWTTDIGGFHGGNPDDPSFRELFVRWFQWGTFCPVMRLHGDREPRQPQHGTTGGAKCRSGAANEVWSYGDEIYEICRKYMLLREQLRPYIRDQMKAAHLDGTPIMRPLFYDFPNDMSVWEVEDEFMFGPTYLCCPVMYPGQRTRKVYLPADAKWQQFQGNDTFDGGSWIDTACPLEMMPVFVRL